MSSVDSPHVLSVTLSSVDEVATAEKKVRSEYLIYEIIILGLCMMQHTCPYRGLLGFGRRYLNRILLYKGIFYDRKQIRKDIIKIWVKSIVPFM